MLQFANMKLTVIIPAYNEEKTVAQVLRKVQSNKLVKEIIVVNDGSTDRTKAQISKVKAQKYRLKLIDKKINEGKGRR